MGSGWWNHCGQCTCSVVMLIEAYRTRTSEEADDAMRKSDEGLESFLVARCPDDVCVRACIWDQRAAN